MPYITEEGPDCEGVFKPYIANMREDTVTGFKHLSFDGSEKSIALTLRGCGKAEIRVDAPDGSLVAELDHDSVSWLSSRASLSEIKSAHALYVRIAHGKLDFAAFAIE